jgi:hypothetical protein|tara:strand:+ start:28986 stop:30383 length:1398 start_codon:yes stop_codon:yes gene_type:complete
MTSFIELREGTLKTAVFTFGRFNPPTTGHEILVNKIITVASRSRADAFVFLSSSQDSKKNPLDYKDKVKWMKKMFKPRGQKLFKYSREQPEDVMKVASLLHDKGYEQIIMVVGSDRINDFKKLLSQYNGVKDKPHGFYDFKKIEIESAGERDPDADDATGMSASKLRSLAIDSDFETFKTGLPDTLSEKDKRILYQLLRKQMKLSVMEKQIKEKFNTSEVLNTSIKRPQPVAPMPKGNTPKQQKKSAASFIAKTLPKEKKVPAIPGVDDVDEVKEGLWIEKVEFEGETYHVDKKAAVIFNYIKSLPYNTQEISYIRGCLKECQGFFDNFTLITEKIKLWELSKLRGLIKKTSDYITVLDEGSGMIDFNKADFSYLHEMVDTLPVDEVNLQDPISNKLQKILGLREWNKNRAGEGQQLELGTDKYRQYVVALTPEEEFKTEQDKKRLMQTERYNKILSKIIASRSK